MNIDLTPEQEQFRNELRTFFDENLPDDLRRKSLHGEKITKAEHVRWQRILAERGWLAPSWAAEYGGPGWGPVERLIYDEESFMAGAPRANIPAIDLLGPVLIEFGTPEQKLRFLPRILSSEDWWCQGFSEPGAGSDLAALAMRAVRDGDHYVVNGTKLWTSYAQMATWIFCLVRTSIEEKKQAGISFLLIPMEQPGVKVSPIHTVGGVHAVNEISIENVRVPVDHLVGREGGAWEITRFLLGHERLVGASLGPSAKYLADLKRVLREGSSGGAGITGSASFRERVASAEIDLLALRLTGMRVIADELAGKAPGPEVSVLKLQGSLLSQKLTGLLAESMGGFVLPDPQGGGASPVPAHEAFQTQQFFDRRKMTIYGGTAEIQRNIIAQRILRI